MKTFFIRFLRGTIVSHWIYISVLTKCYSFQFYFVLSPSMPKEYIFLSINIPDMDFTVHNMKVKAAQSCLTLCEPMDYTVPGLLQARILE